MKLSNITKPVTGLLFWSMLTYILYSFTDSSWNLGISMGVAMLIFMLCYMIRIMQNKTAKFFLHFVVITLFGLAEFGMILYRAPLFIMWIIFIILSIAASFSDKDFISDMNGGYIFISVVVYLIAFIHGTTDMLILYFMEATFIILHYMQQTAIRQEKNIKTMSSYSVMNEKELYSESSKVTFVSHMILYILCILIGLIGRIPFFSMICNKIFKIFNRTFDIVKSFKTGEATYPSDDVGIPEENIEVNEEPVTPVHPAWRIIGIVGFTLIMLYLIFLIVDRIRTSIKNRVYMPDLDVKTEVKQIKEKKKLKKRERTDSYRKAIRRIYKVRIKKGRGRRNDDLVSKTPHEQRNKKISEGYEVSRDFVEMYEKARYGRDNVTKDDVRNMHNL